MEYATTYSPIVGDDNKVIGIVFTGKNKTESDDFKISFIISSIYKDAEFVSKLSEEITLAAQNEAELAQGLNDMVQKFRI